MFDGDFTAMFEAQEHVGASIVAAEVLVLVQIAQERRAHDTCRT